MRQGEKINKILEAERLNLKEFSKLAHISYTAAVDYRKNRYNLSVQQIDKICSVPRFAQYRNMLLSLDEPIGEGTHDSVKLFQGTSKAVPEISKTASQLLKSLQDAGHGEDARDILKALLTAIENAKKD